MFVSRLLAPPSSKSDNAFLKIGSTNNSFSTSFSFIVWNFFTSVDSARCFFDFGFVVPPSCSSFSSSSSSMPSKLLDVKPDNNFPVSDAAESILDA
ncbi:hypothetical protein OGATHE_006730 [Ogataea polymorpha]|uniref:Uncharacterized protein n=1 Tax=Ogataea polymorpha TaxID=460523 RepID=A0A9P8NTB9_9ASCO|nr:hypothetical protein OGATHE_006730 [Ogataea polymorpha]